MYFPCHHFSAA